MIRLQRTQQEALQMIQKGHIGSIHLFLIKGAPSTSACFKVHSRENVSQMYSTDASMSTLEVREFSKNDSHRALTVKGIDIRVHNGGVLYDGKWSTGRLCHGSQT